jgi:hypothetical protein
MNLTATLESAEHKFKQILDEYFITVYDERSLPSHGLNHHRRVWNRARELTLLLAANNLIEDNLFPYGLIIACYLHDIGMSVDPGIRHGHHSRDICSGFLKKNNLRESDYLKVLDAVENHDNKEYETVAGNYSLLSILSIADDLDAFGFTGIYRYVEIYLTRGISPADLGLLIPENARRRFNNFEKIFRFSEELVNRQQKRFDIVDNFFTGYNNQVVKYEFGVKPPSGYCGVIDILQNLINSRTILEALYAEPVKYSYDPIINWFFDGLNSELSV